MSIHPMSNKVSVIMVRRRRSPAQINQEVEWQAERIRWWETHIQQQKTKDDDAEIGEVIRQLFDGRCR